MENREIPGILKQLRSQLGLSQEELAAKLGVAFSTLNRWENGKSAPRGQAKDSIAALMEEVQGADAEQPSAGSRRRRAGRPHASGTTSTVTWASTSACRCSGIENSPS